MGIKFSIYFNKICCEDKNTNKKDKNYNYGKINLEKLSHDSDKFNKKKNFNINNFKFINLIGKGGYGKVFLAENIINKEQYAIKSIPIIPKNKNIKNKENDNIKKIITEKKILSKASHPFIMNLKGYFVSSKKLYLVMDYQEYGDLYTLFKIYKKFSIDIIKYIIIELIIGLDYLHENLNVIYRDLKLQNILIGNKGHIKITDFGLSKCGTNEAHTFCGTISFIAPEVFKNNYNKKVDFWTLGCLIYYMVTGVPPFESKNHQQLIKLIKLGRFNTDLIHDEKLKDLLLKLIEVDPDKRINSSEIKKHEFFSDCSFIIFDLIKEQSPLLNWINEINNFESNKSSNFSQENYFKSILLSNNSKEIFF